MEQTGLQFSRASSSLKPHLFEVSTTKSPLGVEEELVLVEIEVDVEDVLVSGVVVGLLVGVDVV